MAKEIIKPFSSFILVPDDFFVVFENNSAIIVVYELRYIIK